MRHQKESWQVYVMEDTRDAMKIGFRWNEKKCAVAHIKRGCLWESERMKVGESKVIESFMDGSYYNFLAVLENIR